MKERRLCRQAIAGIIFIALWTSPAEARADETFEIGPYAAWRRPLTPPFFPGHPPIRRDVAGAALEWTDAPAPERNGWVLRFGGAVEHQADCPTSASCPFPAGGGDRFVDQTETGTTLPDNHVEYGAHARAGWFWRAVQLEGGLLAYTASIAGTPPPPREPFLLPDAVARFGRRNTFIAVGFGAFTGSAVVSPATYLQGQLLFADRWTTAVTSSFHGGWREIDPYSYFRYDVALRYRIASSARIGVGLALTHGDPAGARLRLGGELRITFEWIRPEQ
jgi:hypothetical protein